MSAPEGFPVETTSVRTVTSDQIKSMYSKRAWREVSQVDQIGAGEANSLSLVKTSDGETEVIKVCPNEYGRANKVKKAAWCAERAASLGIPTNSVKAIHENDPYLGLFVVEKYLQGHEPNNLDQNERISTTKTLANYLAVIHKFQIAGAGEIDENGKGQEDSWPIHISKWINYIEEQIGNNPNSKLFIPSDLIARTFDDLRKNSWLIPNSNSLLHGDPNLKNTLIMGDGQVALIDWDNSLSGDPLYDVAYFESFHDDSTLNQEMRRAYGQASGVDFYHAGVSNIKSRVNYYKKLIELSAVNWYLLKGDYNKFQNALTKLEKRMVPIKI